MEGRGHRLTEHPSDMGVEGWGGTLEEAFEETALAMFEIVLSKEPGDLDGMEESVRIELNCERCTEVDLLVEFLNTLITRSDIEGIFFNKVKVERISKERGGFKLSAVASGIPLDKAAPYLLTEVKAATYYGARVERRGDGLWYAGCVVDL